MIAVGLALAASSTACASAKDFDGIWSVSIMADDANCVTRTIPIQVSDGTISFSGFGATGSGQVTPSGTIRLKIALKEKVVRINGRAHGREASGSWRTAPAGCEGRWSAQIAD
jgi:hypothetical protein